MDKILLDMSNFVFLTVHRYSNDCQIDIYISGSLPRFRFLFSFSYGILISKFTAIITMVKIINSNNYRLFNTFHLTGTHSYFMSIIWFTFPMRLITLWDGYWLLFYFLKKTWGSERLISEIYIYHGEIYTHHLSMNFRAPMFICIF